ncbi:hypothetical protein BAOM_2002 [Peribacillus asahii]|uniref:Uncharacterized protein n=1 Tax=Peribacillus asahii TaxID=228899 RepID=A0A3Q9RLV2_9BACI|nr:hypothetical protein BAOM_2002 [Peribacillus asahii]
MANQGLIGEKIIVTVNREIIKELVKSIKRSKYFIILVLYIRRV